MRGSNPDAQVQTGLDRFDIKAIMVPNPPPYVTYPRDPDDEPVINLAIHVEADYIVTRDKDLLALSDESQPEGRFFRKQFPHLTILDPVAFLQIMQKA